MRAALCLTLLVAACSAAPPAAVPDPYELGTETVGTPLLPYAGEAPTPLSTAVPVTEAPGPETLPVVLLSDSQHPACTSAAQMYEGDTSTADIYVDTLRSITSGRQTVDTQRQVSQHLAYISREVAEMSVSAKVLLDCRADLGDAYVDWAWNDFLDWQERWASTRQNCWKSNPNGPCPWA